MIQLDKIPENIGSFVFTLDIFKEKKKTLSLGKLTRIQVRLYETESDKELGVFSITGIGDKAVQVGELKRINNHWLYQSDPRSLINVKSKFGCCMYVRCRCGCHTPCDPWYNLGEVR